MTITILIILASGVFIFAKYSDNKTKRRIHKDYLKSFLEIERKAIMEIIRALKFYRNYSNYIDEYLGKLPAKPINLAYLIDQLLDAQEDLKYLNDKYYEYQYDWKLPLRKNFGKRFTKLFDYLQQITKADLEKILSTTFWKRRTKGVDILEKLYENGEPYYVPSNFY